MRVKNDYLKLDIQKFADGEISYKVTVDGKEAEKNIKNLSKNADGLSKKFISFGSKMTIGVTAPLTALATAGIKYNASMETYLTNLTTLMQGNEKEASKLLQTLKEMAATTPYETTDLVKATQKMMAFGISANDSLQYLQMLGDIAMGDANKMDSLTLAFSQIGASGRATMEDINQMIDQGFNPLTIIAQKTGENMGDLRDRVSDGAVSFQEIADAMKTATSEGGIYFGSMDKASQTTAGKISTLKDDFNSALGSMTEVLLPFVTNIVTKLSQIFQWINSLDQSQKNMILTVLGVLAAIGPLLMILGQIMPLLSALPAVIAFITSPIGLVVAAVVALIGVFAYLMATSEEFRVAMQTIFSFVWSIIQPIIQNIINLFNGLVQIIKGCVLVIGGILNGDFEMIAKGFGSIFKGIGNVVIAVLNGVINTINKFLKFFTTGINALISAANKVPGVNLKKVNLKIPNIPKLATGTNYIAREGLAYLHEGEAVVPKKYNPAIGGYGNFNQPIYVTVNADMDVNKFGKAFVRDIKTFSGGTKNSYNYGGGK